MPSRTSAMLAPSRENSGLRTNEVPRFAALGSSSKKSRQQIRMLGKHLPQQSEYALVGKDRLPGRLDPAGRCCCELFTERVLKHPFPGIEFERERDFAICQCRCANWRRRSADTYARHAPKTKP